MAAQGGVLEFERTPQKGIVRRQGYFIANGSGSIPAGNVVGRVLTVSHTATGNYTVVIDKPFKSLISIQTQLGNIAQGNLELLVDIANSNVSNGTFKLQCFSTANAATDLPAGCYCWLVITGSTWAGNTAA